MFERLLIFVLIGLAIFYLIVDKFRCAKCGHKVRAWTGTPKRWECPKCQGPLTRHYPHQYRLVCKVHHRPFEARMNFPVLDEPWAAAVSELEALQPGDWGDDFTPTAQ